MKFTLHGDRSPVIRSLLLMLLFTMLSQNPQIAIRISNHTGLVRAKDEVLNELAELLAGLIANAGVLLSEEGDGTLIILEPTELLSHGVLATL